MQCINIAKKLLAFDPTMIDSVSSSGDTPLHHIVCTGNIELIDYVMRLKPSTMPVKNSDGSTVLHLAVMYLTLDGSDDDDNKSFQRILDCHLNDITVANPLGETPYHIAREHNEEFAISMFERCVTVDTLVALHTHPLFDPLDVTHVRQLVAKETATLDHCLLPDLHLIVHEYIGTCKPNKKRPRE